MNVASATSATAGPTRWTYDWPVPPPPGFQGWQMEPDFHNRWTLHSETGMPGTLAYLFRRCRNEDITYRLQISPHFARLRNMKSTSTSRFAPVTSPYLSAEDIAGWWAELLLTNTVPNDDPST